MKNKFKAFNLTFYVMGRLLFWVPSGEDENKRWHDLLLSAVLCGDDINPPARPGDRWPERRRSLWICTITQSFRSYTWTLFCPSFFSTLTIHWRRYRDFADCSYTATCCPGGKMDTDKMAEVFWRWNRRPAAARRPRIRRVRNDDAPPV